MRNFAVCSKFAVPVDEITGIYFKNTPDHLVVQTDDKDYVVYDPSTARNLIMSLESCTNIQGAYADSLDRKIETVLS